MLKCEEKKQKRTMPVTFCEASGTDLLTLLFGLNVTPNDLLCNHLFQQILTNIGTHVQFSVYICLLQQIITLHMSHTCASR